MDSSRPIFPNASNRVVAYFNTPEIENYSYGPGHPMKPDRLRQTRDLIESYAVDYFIRVCSPFPVGVYEMCEFHSLEYIDFLRRCHSETAGDPAKSGLLRKFHLTDNCPALEGVFEFCRASVGGSIGSAAKLNDRTADISINWAGGFHHAKKSEASGFSYVNDVVLGILELLKVHKRVLYVNIDIHHGDAVEEAFYYTDRVMTVSFHQFGVFPGTGHIKDIGAGTGKKYALNVPFSEGLNDDHLRNMFRPIIGKAMEVYQPEVVVLQSGASSLAGDRMGRFNLSVKGHADCLVFLMSFNVPLMVLGGGGYTTAVTVGMEGDFEDSALTLAVERRLFNNLNTDKDLEKIRSVLLAQLSEIEHAPSVPFHQTPSTAKVPEEDEPEMDVKPKRLWNSVTFYDSDDVHEDEDDDDDSGGDEGKLKGEDGDKDEDAAGNSGDKDEDAAGNSDEDEDEDAAGNSGDKDEDAAGNSDEGGDEGELEDEDGEEGESSASSIGDHNDFSNDSDSSEKSSSSSGESSSSSGESSSSSGESSSSSGSDDYTRNYNKSSSDEDENRYEEPIYNDDDIDGHFYS